MKTLKHPPELLALEPGWLDAWRSVRAAQPPLTDGLRAAMTDGLMPACVSRAAQETQVQSGGIAVVSITAPIEQMATVWSYYGFTVSTEVLGVLLRQLASRDDVSAIVLRIHSPGGTVAGTLELAEDIRAIRDQKPVVAVVESLAASAAYWLAAQASEIVISPSGHAGSIGVILEHQDWSGAYEQAGISPTLITSSEHKAEGSDLAPLTEPDRERFQAVVNELHRAFVSAVAKGRGVTPAAVEKNFGQGRLLTASEALKAGLADRSGTLRETLQRLARGKGPRPGSRAATGTQPPVTGGAGNPEVNGAAHEGSLAAVQPASAAMTTDDAAGRKNYWRARARVVAQRAVNVKVS